MKKIWDIFMALVYCLCAKYDSLNFDGYNLFWRSFYPNSFYEKKIIYGEPECINASLPYAKINAKIKKKNLKKIFLLRF